ncbi:hypothetical protein K435DRAFT_71337 [Dendrothele bispora CBS 962.96]|uniref:Uncharacterized protein n=1 Tax=Dendrothele bispora (strain CBS 962.96) TaxID=1314807 RepID=A0A4S8M5S2_DENBC|nr:hypothetical protein K435DRAFT_71337 [Dendrothele bispora CBS 962.96]
MEEEHEISLRHLPDVSQFSSFQLQQNHNDLSDTELAVENSFQIPNTLQSKDAREYSYLLADVEEDFFANLDGRENGDEDSFVIPTTGMGLRRSPRKRRGVTGSGIGTGTVGSATQSHSKAKTNVLGPSNTPKAKSRSKSRSISPMKGRKPASNLTRLAEDEEDQADPISTPRRMAKLKSEIALLDEEFDFDMEGISENSMQAFKTDPKPTTQLATSSTPVPVAQPRKSIFLRSPLGPFDFSSIGSAEPSTSDDLVHPQPSEKQTSESDKSKEAASGKARTSSRTAITKPPLAGTTTTTEPEPVATSAVSVSTDNTSIRTQNTTTRARSRSKTLSKPISTTALPRLTDAVLVNHPQAQISQVESCFSSNVAPASLDTHISTVASFVKANKPVSAPTLMPAPSNVDEGSKSTDEEEPEQERVGESSLESAVQDR